MNQANLVAQNIEDQSVMTPECNLRSRCPRKNVRQVAFGSCQGRSFVADGSAVAQGLAELCGLQLTSQNALPTVLPSYVEMWREDNAVSGWGVQGNSHERLDGSCSRSEIILGVPRRE